MGKDPLILVSRKRTISCKRQLNLAFLGDRLREVLFYVNHMDG